MFKFRNNSPPFTRGIELDFTFSFGHHAQAAGLFISFARTKETKQRKFAAPVPKLKFSLFS